MVGWVFRSLSGCCRYSTCILSYLNHGTSSKTLNWQFCCGEWALW